MSQDEEGNEQGFISSVILETAGDELAGDHALGVSALTVVDAYDFAKSGGQLQIGPMTYTYTTYDDDTGIITLAAPTTRAHSDGDVVATLPISKQKIANVELTGGGPGIEVLVGLEFDRQIPEGIREDDDRESVTLRFDGDEYVLESVNGGGDVPENPDLVEITNLCTDPKPLDFLNWVGGAGGGTGPFGNQAYLDSTHAAQGLYLRVNNGASGYNADLLLPGDGPAVDASGAGVWYGTAAKPTVFNADLAFSVRGYSADLDSDCSFRVTFFDAAGTQLTAADDLGVVNISESFARGVFYTFHGGVDYSTVVATLPTVYSVLLNLNVRDDAAYPTRVSKDWFFGSCMITAGGALPEGSGAYRDADSVGWVVNADGTTTGTVDLGAFPEWSDIANKPTEFPGNPGPTGPDGATGPTGPQGAPSPMVWVVDDVTAEGIPLAAIPNEQFLLDMATGDFFQIYQT